MEALINVLEALENTLELERPMDRFTKRAIEKAIGYLQAQQGQTQFCGECEQKAKRAEQVRTDVLCKVGRLTDADVYAEFVEIFDKPKVQPEKP